MEGLLATIGTPSAIVWSAFALGSGVAALIGASAHIQRAYYQWRLDRRLARDPYILRDEMNEYLAEIGDDLPSFEPARFAAASLLGGALFAVPIWLAERHLEHWWEIGSIALGVGAFLYAWWKWLNDPDAPRPVLPDAEIPREAVAAFVTAVALVGLFLLFLVWFF